MLYVFFKRKANLGHREPVGIYTIGITFSLLANDKLLNICEAILKEKLSQTI